MVLLKYNPTGFALGYMVSLVLGLSVFVTLLTWIIKYSPLGWDAPDHQFNYHPLFMILGLVVFYGNGILIYRGFRSQAKAHLKVAHAVVQGLALFFTIFGLCIIFIYHNRQNYPHLTSFHSWIGLISALLFGLQWAGGLVTFLFPGLRGSIRATVLPYHVFAGVGIFVMSVASCLTGIMAKSRYVSGIGERVALNMMGMLILAFALSVGFLLIKPEFKRRPNEHETPNNSLEGTHSVQSSS